MILWGIWSFVHYAGDFAAFPQHKIWELVRFQCDCIRFREVTQMSSMLRYLQRTRGF